MKVLLLSPTTDSGCISLKRSIEYLIKQVKGIEDWIKKILSQDVSMITNYYQASKELVWLLRVSLFVTQVILHALIAEEPLWNKHHLSMSQVPAFAIKKTPSEIIVHFQLGIILWCFIIKSCFLKKIAFF